MSRNQLTCSLGIFCCIVLYAMSKILIYLFLIESESLLGFVDTTQLFTLNIFFF